MHSEFEQSKQTNAAQNDFKVSDDRLTNAPRNIVPQAGLKTGTL